MVSNLDGRLSLSNLLPFDSEVDAHLPNVPQKYKRSQVKLNLTLFSTGGVYLPPLREFSIFDRKTVSNGGESGMKTQVW